jgi:hypothetical protein
MFQRDMRMTTVDSILLLEFDFLSFFLELVGMDKYCKTEGLQISQIDKDEHVTEILDRNISLELFTVIENQ